MKKKKQRGMLLIIIILVVVAIAGIYFGIIYPRYNASYSNAASTSIAVPTVQVSLTSAADGEPHDIQADFTVEIDNSISGSITRSELHGYITEIMATLEYDKIIGADSVDYVKAEVKKQLAGYVEEEKLQGIYITNLNTSETLPPIEAGGRQNKVFENLFPNS